MKNPKRHQKSKKRSRGLNSSGDGVSGAGGSGGRDKRDSDKDKIENDVIESLREAFCSVSLEDVTAAFKEACGDPNKAADILSDLVENSDDPSTWSVWSGFSGPESGSTSEYGTGSSSSVSDGFMENGCVQNLIRQRRFKASKQNRVVAATGTVSTVIGKEYMKPNPVKKEVSTMPRFKGIQGNGNRVADTEEAKQFLCSMLGDDSQLSMAVITDVLCQCEYEVDKALDILLEMSSPSCDNSLDDGCYIDALSHRESLADKTSDCLPYSSLSELDDNFWNTDYNERNYARALTCSEGPSTSSRRSNEVDLPQKVLESLFNTHQSPRHEPENLNWKNVVKKLQSLGSISHATSQLDSCGKEGDGYYEHRRDANAQWNQMKSYYQTAAEAHSRGNRAYAAYLSDQGREVGKSAKRADERASQDIFVARNKGIENVITIDLHGQHVKEAMKLLKLHLLFASYVPSVQTLRVITGCGTHGFGRSKVKESVVKLLEREGVKYREENRGTLIMKLHLDGPLRLRGFRFVADDDDDGPPLFL